MAASCTVLAVKPRAFLVYAVVVSALELALLLAVLLLVLPALGLKVPDWAVALIATGMTLMSVILTKLNLRTIGIRPSRSPDVGVRAQVVKALEPRGYVRVGNELWPAVCEHGTAGSGTAVMIVRMEGLRLVVEPVGDEE